MCIRIIRAFVELSVIASLFIITGCNIEGTQDPAGSSDTQEWKQLVNLSGIWKFSVGDNPNWASAVYNDDNWERNKVPSSWENQGFHGYDGYAWYRNTFDVPVKYSNSIIYLFLGFVDDVDQVFINGKQVGYSGSFPPQYMTAYDINRRYPVPTEVLNFTKKNTIAIRVYDEELEGGILRGDIGIYTPEYSFQNGINLVGTWKFRTGDNPAWKENKFNDNEWADLIVPGFWETQGYPDYDGFAWYRKSVFLPEKYKGEKLILVMGKIDDLDEVYINGKLIGSTGNMNTRDDADNYLKLRGYYLSGNELRFGEKNLIAVRVYDGFKDGGIYEGPVTLVPQKEYTAYWNRLRNGENIINKIFN
jgi:sialate O-acetylesterase